MDSHWGLSDSKSPQVSMTLLSILANLNNDVGWMSPFVLIFTSLPGLTSIFFTVPGAPISISSLFSCSTVFYFSSKVQILFLLFIFFEFYSVVSRENKVNHFASSLFLLIIIRSVVSPRSSHPFVLQNPREFCASHSPGKNLDWADTICSYGQIQISCTIPRGSPCPPSRV